MVELQTRRSNFSRWWTLRYLIRTTENYENMIYVLGRYKEAILFDASNQSDVYIDKLVFYTNKQERRLVTLGNLLLRAYQGSII